MTLGTSGEPGVVRVIPGDALEPERVPVVADDRPLQRGADVLDQRVDNPLTFLRAGPAAALDERPSLPDRTQDAGPAPGSGGPHCRRGDEAVDVLILVMSIVNRCGINLEEAFRVKGSPQRGPRLGLAWRYATGRYGSQQAHRPARQLGVRQEQRRGRDPRPLRTRPGDCRAGQPAPRRAPRA